MKLFHFLAASLCTLLVLAACSEEPRDFTVYSPGEYKGTLDPLLTKNLDQQLEDRFMAVQTDR